MRRLFRRVFVLGAFAGGAYAVWRWWQAQASPTGVQWEPQPAPFPPAPRVAGPASASGGESGWTEPVDGTCPPGYPVKAKLGSGIFHVPGGTNYDRTVPDRCYASPENAEADGLRPAKR